MKPSEADIAAEITAQVTARGAGKTICPSEVARAFGDDWRHLMPVVRGVGAPVAGRGEITLTQKGGPGGACANRTFRVERWAAAGQSGRMKTQSVDTSFGTLTLREDAGAIVALDWGRAPKADRSDLLTEAAAQLRAYDAGALENFDLPLDVRGSDLQRRVCDAMLAIPFGYTQTYGEIGKALNMPA